MRQPATGLVHRVDTQTSDEKSTTTQGQRMNALKHGLRSKSVLLPGDDAAEFEKRRRDLHATYRPLTPLEARCVDRIAACEWRMERWQRWEQGLNTKLDDLLGEGPDGPAAQHSNPDTHHWQHRSTDCTLQERRLEKSMLTTERRLLTLQSMRRNRLLAGASVAGREEAAGNGAAREPVQAVLSGAALLGASGEPPAPTRPTDIEQREVVLSGRDARPTDIEQREAVPITRVARMNEVAAATVPSANPEPIFGYVAPTGVASDPMYPPLPGALGGVGEVASLSGQEATAFPAAAMPCSYGAIEIGNKQKETPAHPPAAPAPTAGRGAALPGAIAEKWVVMRPWEPPCGPVGVSSTVGTTASSTASIAMVASGNLPIA